VPALRQAPTIHDLSIHAAGDEACAEPATAGGAAPPGR
jgi:hypothetical protein